MISANKCEPSSHQKSVWSRLKIKYSYSQRVWTSVSAPHGKTSFTRSFAVLETSAELAEGAMLVTLTVGGWEQTNEEVKSLSPA